MLMAGTSKHDRISAKQAEIKVKTDQKMMGRLLPKQGTGNGTERS
jgi:hypothetical protein